MSTKSLLTKVASCVTIVSIVVGVSVVHVELAHAAALYNLSDTLSTVSAGDASDHTIQFVTPTGVSTGEDISITFPVGWDLNNLATTSINFGTSTSASCSGFSYAPINTVASGLTWGVATTTTTLTLTSGTAVVPANRCVQFKLGSNATFETTTATTTILNPSSATTSIITIGGSFGDMGLISVTILSDDAVALSGTVNQSISFTISTTTIYFGTLGSGGAKYASSTNSSGDSTETVAHTLSVGTNASYGFTVTVRGQTLTSQQNPANTISAIGGSIASSTPGTEQFGIRATESGGTGVTVSSPYSYATSYGYGATATTSSTFAVGSGSTQTSTLSLRYITNISAVTEAGTYSTNLNYVATANY